ncbi:GGDEF domain-containing protein [Paenibacillus sp. YIM B09110]|uniref:GGDEF domain-containing protein n=1 Tax=Paenibacillus sp. YIM B09110 TaxID=3126102 RepID=UPI00301E0CA9
MTKKIYFSAAILSIAGFQLILFLYNKENIRIAYCSFIIAFMIIPVYRLILGKGRSLLMRIIGCLYLIIFAGSMLRGAVALVSGDLVSFFKPGIYQLMFVLAFFLLTIMGNIGFILLLKEKSNQELARLASYDDLTGTLNRRTFSAQALLCLADYAKKCSPVSYLLFDIDLFKTINDTYGHHVGDQVLQDLTSRIRQILSNNDLFVRYGGDEFGILLPGKDEAESADIAEQIKQMLSEEKIVSSPPITYTVSIGVLTVIPDQNTQLETLYICCDKALYMAKRNGRNGIIRSRIDEQVAVHS